MTTREGLQQELKQVRREMGGLNPKTSTYKKLREREAQLMKQLNI